MATLDQRPGRLDLKCAAADDRTWTLDFTGYTFSGDTWAATVFRQGGSTLATLTVTSVDSNTLTVAYNGGDLSAGRYQWRLVNSTDTQTLLAGEFKAGSSAEAAESGSSSETVSVVGGTATVTVVAGLSSSGAQTLIDTSVTTHNDDTTSVHGIADTSVLVTTTAQRTTIDVPRRNTIVLLGDSITAANAITGTSPSLQHGANGWFHHANFALGGAFTLAANYAVSGKRADEVLSGQVPQVLAMSTLPGWVGVLCGTNDFAISRTTAQVQADLAAIIAALTGAGINVVMGTITPRNAYQASIRTVNRWLKETAAAGTYPGLHVVDWYSQLAGTDGEPSAALFHDNLHPSHSGASVMGKVWAAAMAGRANVVDHLPQPGDASNLIANPFQTGTTGTKGTGVTGNVSTSWTVSRGGGTPDCVASKVARTDGVAGEWMQLAVTNGSSSNWIQATIPVTTTGMAIGDRLVYAMEIEADTPFPMLWAVFDSSQSNAAAGGGMGHFGAVSGYTIAAWASLPTRGVIRSTPWAIPVGHSLPFSAMTLRLRIFNATAGAIRLGRVGFWNLGPA